MDKSEVKTSNSTIDDNLKVSYYKKKVCFNILDQKVNLLGFKSFRYMQRIALVYNTDICIDIIITSYFFSLKLFNLFCR